VLISSARAVITEPDRDMPIPSRAQGAPERRPSTAAPAVRASAYSAFCVGSAVATAPRTAVLAADSEDGRNSRAHR
jgi:hypothetical protein